MQETKRTKRICGVCSGVLGSATLLVLGILMCGGACAQGFVTEETGVAINLSDYEYNFTALNHTVDDYSLNFTYAVPVQAGDVLCVNADMNTNSSVLCMDIDGFSLLFEGVDSEAVVNEVLNHTYLSCSAYNVTSYNQTIVIGENVSWVCFVLIADDVTQPLTGNITAIRYSHSDLELGPSLNGTAFYEMYSAWKMQQAGGPSWVPPELAPDEMSISAEDGLAEFGPITGPDLSTPVVAEEGTDLGLLTGTPITGPDAGYTPYYAGTYGLDAAAQEARDSWYRAYEASLVDAVDYA